MAGGNEERKNVRPTGVDPALPVDPGVGVEAAPSAAAIDLPPEPQAPRRGRGTGTTREVAALAAPLVIQNLSYTLLGVTDTYFVSRVGTQELAAVGLGGILFFTVMLLFRGITNSTVVFVGRAYGERDNRKIGHAVWRAINAAAWLSLPVLALPWLFGLVFPFMAPADSPQVVALGTTYLVIRTFEIPIQMFTAIVWGFMVGRGDSRTPMILAWTVVLLNIFFDWVLVLGNLGAPALGVAGAAYATLLAAVVNATIGGFLLWSRENDALYGTRSWFVARLPDLRAVFRVGVPMGVGDFVGISVFSAFFVLLGQLGTEQLAATQIAVQYMSVSFTYGIAVAMAASSLVSRHLGAKDPARAELVTKRAAVLGMIGMGLVGMTYLIAPATLIGMFTDDAAVIRAGVVVLTLAAVYQVFDALAIVIGGALNGAGDTRFTMIAKAAFGWGVFLPFAWLLAFPLGFGLTGAWLGAITYLTGLAVIFGLRFRSGRWKDIQLG